jgi:D-alanyl-D-alanine carboxypeptidase
MENTLFTLHSATRPLTALCLLAALSACAADGDNKPAPQPVPATLQADLQRIVDDAVANQVSPGAVVQITTGDGASWSTARGVADLADAAAMPVDAHFRAGSMLKTFIATAVLQRVESGELSLDDALTDRLPDDITQRIPNAERIQLRMLLSHRSGIPDWVDAGVDQLVMTDPAHVWTLDAILERVASHSPLFEPGAQYAYSNTNYVLLGEILGRVSGHSWRGAVREQVFERAGLAHTSLPEPGDLECPAPCAHGYVKVDDALVDLTRVDPSMAGASGGHALITTTADLSHFLRELRSGALFDEASTLETMLAFEPAHEPQDPLVGYGLGVMKFELDGASALGHIGTTAGYQGFMLYLPNTDRYLSGFINQMSDLGSVLGPLFERVAAP